MTRKDDLPPTVPESTLDGLQETIEDDLRGLASNARDSGLLVKVSLADAISCVRQRFSRARAAAKRALAATERTS